MAKSAKTTRVAEAWAKFEAMVIPASAGPDQRQSMKFAFYGGAMILLDEIMRLLDPGEEPTDADLANMTAIHNELQAFAQACKGAKVN